MASLADRVSYAWQIIAGREPLPSDLERKQLMSILSRLAALEAAAPVAAFDPAPLQAELDAVKADLAALKDAPAPVADVSAVEASVAALSDKLTSLGNDLDTLSNDVSHIHDEIGDAAPLAAA